MSTKHNKSSLHEVMSNIDWSLFDKQKQSFVDVINRLSEQRDHLDGLLNMLDAIQDAWQQQSLDPRFAGWPDISLMHQRIDNLPNAPEWMLDLFYRSDDRECVFHWEDVDGFDGFICYGRLAKDVRVQWGCRRWTSSKAMRDRYKYNGDDPDDVIISKHSGETREHAFDLNDWVNAVCKHYGWVF